MERDTAEVWSTITPADLLRTIVRRLPSIVLVTLVVVVAVGAILFVWPNQYASDGLLYVRLGRGAVSVDPTTQSTGSVSLQESRRSEVVSISEMMDSREIANRVVSSVGVRHINEPRTWIERVLRSVLAWVPSSGPKQMDSGAFARQVAHEEAVRRVHDSVEINVPKNGYTIAVNARTYDPLLSQAIVQSILDEYGSFHVEAHRSTGSLDFFEDQTRESRQQALKTRTDLQRVRGQMGWTSTESAEQTLQERILNLKLELDKTESDLADSKALVDVLENQLTEVDHWIPMEVNTVANNAADEMRTVLYEHQVKDGDRLSKVTPSHPRYRMLQEKLAQSEEIVSSEGDEREQRRETINPVHIKLETDYRSTLVKSAGLESRRHAVKQSLAAAEQDLRRLNADMVQLAELTWTADIAESNYLSHAASLESARLVHELDNQNMSDVSVIQHASLNLKKVGPPRGALLVVGAMLGWCLGLLQALVRENPVVRPRDEAITVAPGETSSELVGEPPHHRRKRRSRQVVPQEASSVEVGTHPR